MIYFDPQKQTFLDTTIHGEDIAEKNKDLIEINQEQHYSLLDALNRGAKIKDDLSILEKPSPLHEWDDEKKAFILPKDAEKNALKQAKAQKINELNILSQTLINTQSGANELPDFEVQSWTLQAIEAKAWQNDKTAPTPVLDSIAKQRNLPADALKTAALRKTLAYETLTAQIVGQRQALQTRIENAKTIDELNAINITFQAA
ncbi:MAG: phage tail protein [Neisseriaceae bacterium]|nr:phage tail protein [Neisseriaceae bacterium]